MGMVALTGSDESEGTRRAEAPSAPRRRARVGANMVADRRGA